VTSVVLSARLDQNPCVNMCERLLEDCEWVKDVKTGPHNTAALEPARPRGRCRRLLPGGTFYTRCGVRVYRDTVVPSTARASGRTAFVLVLIEPSQPMST